MKLGYCLLFIKKIFTISDTFIFFNDCIVKCNNQDQLIQCSNFFNSSEKIFDLENFEGKIFKIIKNLTKTPPFLTVLSCKDIQPLFELKNQLNFNNLQIFDDFFLNLTLSIIDSNIKYDEFVQPLEYDYIKNWAPGLTDIIFKKRDNKFYLLKIGEDDILPSFKHENSQKMLVLTKDICKILVDTDENTLNLFEKFIFYNDIKEVVILDYKLTQSFVRILSRLKNVISLVYETDEKIRLPPNIEILEHIESLSLFINFTDFPLMKSINSLTNLKSLTLTTEKSYHSLVEHLPNLINLKKLKLSNLWISPLDIKIISTFTKLNSLDISGYTHANISKALVNLKELIKLKIVIGNICNTFIPEDQRNFILPENLDNLKYLYLDVKEIGPGFGSKLSYGLENLSILNAKINDDDLKMIFEIDTLKSLNIRNKNEGINDWKDITKLSNLSSLNISGISLKPSNLISFSKLKNLKELNLSNTVVSDEDLYNGEENLGCFEGVLECIGDFENLEVLDVSGNNWVKYILKHLPKLKNLKQIRLEKCSISLLDLNLPFITHLDLSNNNLTTVSIKKISEFTKLISLNLSNSITKDVCISSLTKLRQLKNLTINNMKMTKEQLDVVILIAKNLFSLELKDSGVRDIDKLKSWKLKKLEITNTSLGLQDIKALSRLPTLEEISLDYTRLGSSELNFLTKYTKVSLKRACTNSKNKHLIERMRIRDSTF